MPQIRSNIESLNPATPGLPLRIAIILAVMAVASIQAKADTVNTALAKIKAAILCTNQGLCSNLQEAKMIHDAGQAVIDEDKKGGKSIKGDSGLNGFPADGDILAEVLTPGSINLLTFQFLDPNTLLPTSGPSIASVFYAFSDTPDLPGSFTALGTSTNASSNFALSFTAFTTEEAIVATPLDASGNPIFIPDVNGVGNLALGVVADLVAPEPPALSLALLGGLLALTASKTGRHKNLWLSRG